MKRIDGLQFAARLLQGAALLCLSFPAAPVNQITLTIDDIVTPAASLKRISASLTPDGITQIAIGELNIFGRSLNNLAVTCTTFDFSNGVIRCPHGRLSIGQASADLNFTYAAATRRLDLSIAPSAQEHWQITGSFVSERWQAELSVAGGQLMRFASLLPETHPRPSKGIVAGRLAASGTADGISKIAGDLRISDLAFADTAGLHAAEKLSGSLTLAADRTDAGLRWRAGVAWDNGELFWAPLYFSSGGHHLDMRGSLANERLQVEEGTLRLADVGESRFSLDWDMKEGLRSLTADAAGLNGSGLYLRLLKPFLEKTAFDQLTVNGKLNAHLVYADNAVQQCDLMLADITLDDARGRFSLEKLNATIPWRSNAETKAGIRFGGAKLLGIPIGAFEVSLRMNAFDFNVDEVTIPVVDGKLLIRDLRASRQKEDWRWQFSGVLLPVSMEATTKALNIPIMRGILSATIPRVTYQNGTIDVGGGIGIRVFDGDVAITQLKLADLLGRAPRLYADVEMRGLDLDLVTSTFKFGSMQGRIDADVKGLELSNWQPVKLDARVESSAGNYRKKISQQAVQNISALGGAGAAAAIERSFLRFFEEFGYQKIGLSCRLRNNVCEMSGVESTPQGYVIVKGGGIPSITVTGYNHYVGWNELLARLSRITQGNVQPIIQ